MTIVNYPSIRDISRSWLYFWDENLTALSIPVRYQAADVGPAVADRLVIASPALEWRVSPVIPDTVEASFRLRVVTQQKPGEALSAYERNLAVQLSINNCLFSAERSVSGFSTGNNPVYAIPLRQFDLQGNPTVMVDPAGLRYEQTSAWISREPDAVNRSVWTLDIVVGVSA